MLHFFLFLFFSSSISDRFQLGSVKAAAASSWQTLSGSPPLIVSRGDNSIFPDQTQYAYLFAVITGASNASAYLCDVQLTSDSVPICRTGLDLSSSTDINNTLPNLQSQHDVNGHPLTAFFSVDITYAQVEQNLTAVQANPARPVSYFYSFILTPDQVYNITAGPLWLNVEYPSFYSQFKLDIESVIASLPPLTPIAYLSSPEIGFLKAMKPKLPKATKLLLKFLSKTETEPSTNQTYGTILANLSAIAGYASGIVVPKDYIWTVEKSGYLSTESSLIADAHAVKLAVYAYDFVNELVNPVVYNYSFNPVLEYLQYAPENGSNVDGFFTDFPTTAAEALACYRSVPSLSETSSKRPIILSHNGASGDYPGCTLLSYEAAIQGGADYIDCTVQMTKDGVAICRESPDLITNTDVSTHPEFFNSRLTAIPQLDPPKGIYTFNMTLAEIQTLKATSNPSEYVAYQIPVNTAFDGQERILTLSDFLSYAKNQSVNVLINIQNGYFLYTELGLDVVGAVVTNLTSASLDGGALIVSEDSAVLLRLGQLLPNDTTTSLVYRVAGSNFTITEEVVGEIKGFATHVALPKGLVQPTYQFYLANSTGIVDLFHSHNITVLVSFLRNIFVSLAFDYESDPLAEIATMVNVFQVDGIITDNPATATAYLNNGCLNQKTENSGLNYNSSLVQPGAFLTFLTTQLVPGFYTPEASGPLLNVTQTALPPTATSSAASSILGNNGTASAPEKAPSSSAAAAAMETSIAFYSCLLIGSMAMTFKWL